MAKIGERVESKDTASKKIDSLSRVVDELYPKPPEVSRGVATIAEDFGRALVQSAVISPLWNGLGQLVSFGHLSQVSIVNEDNAKNSVADSWAQTIGGALGMAADFYVLSRLNCRVFGEAANADKVTSLSLGQRSLTRATEGAKLGAFYGAVLTPSDPNGNLLWGRIANAGSQALTFGTLNGGAEALGALKAFAKFKPGTFGNAFADMSIAGVAGMPAGVMGAVADSALNGHPLTGSDVKQAAVNYGIVGFALAGITHGVTAFKLGKSSKSSESMRGQPHNDASQSLQTAVALSNLSKDDKPAFRFDEPTLGDRLNFFGHSSPAGFGSDSMSSLADLGQSISALKTMMASKELPVSARSDKSTWRFIPEKATELDASQLELPKPLDSSPESTEQGDKIVSIKRYINSAGAPAREYIARVVKHSDITIIGEQHTLEGPNPHRVLAGQVISELPAGSTLAVELPASLKQIFEEFNNERGSDFRLPTPTGNMRSLQPALSILSAIQGNAPELIDMWKSARDNGVRVVPIDAEPDPSVKLTSEHREGKLAEELLALYRERQSQPIVAWIGDIHAARNTEAGVPLLAQRIAESPEFASGQSKLSTVFSQISEVEAERLPLQVLAKEVSEPVGIPIRQNGQQAPIAELPVLDKSTAKAAKAALTVSNYDHLVMYPPSPLEASANYYMRRVDALMANLRTGNIGGLPQFGQTPLLADEDSFLPVKPVGTSRGDFTSPDLSGLDALHFDQPFDFRTIIDILEMPTPTLKYFTIRYATEVGHELQQTFGTKDLRTIPTIEVTLGASDALRVSYRPQFNDLYITGFKAEQPGRSMMIQLDVRGLPASGHTIDDPNDSLADAFEASGLSSLANELRQN